MSGRPAPEPDDASAPFWDACARHELVIQKCSTCNTFRHPPRPMCPSCRSFEHEWVRAAGRGVIWSWVVAHPPLLPAFAEIAPYSVVVVELEEGVRMIGRLLGIANDDIREGLPVIADWEDLDEDVALAAWRPA